MAVELRGVFDRFANANIGAMPDMALSMSASVGLGFSDSRAVADMICPDWQ
jgi:hypothetical protein